MLLIILSPFAILCGIVSVAIIYAILNKIIEMIMDYIKAINKYRTSFSIKKRLGINNIRNIDKTAKTSRFICTFTSIYQLFITQRYEYQVTLFYCRNHLVVCRL